MLEKSLNKRISTNGFKDLAGLATLYNEFFLRQDYRWWYEVQPGDIVVDIGGCIGMFTCLALDSGASKVYTIEPNSTLAKTILENTAIHIFNKKDSPVTIINKAIGSNTTFLKNVFGNIYTNTNRPLHQAEADMTEEEFNSLEYITFKDFIKLYDIKHIDYLKIDCEGGEFDILTSENLEYIKNNVKHIAVEVHIGAFEDGPEKFMNLRDNFLFHFDRNQIKFLEPYGYHNTFNVNWLERPSGWESCYWMIYICNESFKG